MTAFGKEGTTIFDAVKSSSGDFEILYCTESLIEDNINALNSSAGAQFSPYAVLLRLRAYSLSHENIA